MDPTSVVGAAGGIVSLGAQVLGAIGAVKQSLDAATSLPVRDAELIRLRLETSVDLLSKWMRHWRVECKSWSESDIEDSLWGRNRRRTLSQLLADIHHLCLNMLQTVSHDEKPARRADATRRLKWWRSKVRRSAGTGTDKGPVTVIGRRPVDLELLRQQTDQFVDLLDVLITVSNLHFQARLVSSSSLVSSYSEDDLLKEAIRGWGESVVLYEECMRRKLDVNLEIDLFCDDFDRDPQPRAASATSAAATASAAASTGPPVSRRAGGKSYHFYYLADSHGTRELRLRPLSRAEVDAMRRDVASTQDLVKVLGSTTQSEQILCLQNRSYYHLEVLGKPQRTYYRPLPLAMLFDFPIGNFKDLGALSLRERYHLARVVAEFGLFSLGTPWLSHFNSRTLQRLSSPHTKQRYVVHISAADRPSKSRAAPPASARYQLFSLGVLLLEIALATHMYAFEVQSLDAKAHAFVRVGSEMGHDYRAACEFCLINGEEMAPQTGSPIRQVSEGQVPLFTSDTSSSDGDHPKEQVDASPMDEASTFELPHRPAPATLPRKRGEQEPKTNDSPPRGAACPSPPESPGSELRYILSQYRSRVFVPLDEVYRAISEGI